MTPDSSDKPSEALPVSDSVAATEQPHYVLRRGEILGPFDIVQLRELVSGGMLEYDDFVQQAGSSEWLPLRWLLIPDDAQDLDGALAPTWKTLLKWSWLRLRYNLDEQSLSAGWVCLGLALAGLFLSRWPMLLWAPWAVLAFFGGVALYRRERVGPGIALMLSSAIIPGSIWAYFWTAMPVPTDRIEQTGAAPIAAAPALIPPLPVIAIPSEPSPQVQPVEPMPLGLVPVAVAATPQMIEKPLPALEAPSQAAPPIPVEVPSNVPSLQVPDGAGQVVVDFASKIGAAVKSAVSSELPKSSAELVTQHSSDLVIVADETTGGAGSGFICDFRGKPALITNIHVLAGMRQPKFTRLDNSKITPAGTPSAAVGHDILHYPLPPGTALPKLRATQNVEEVAAIGDEVYVLGNSEGARVITPLTGKISGLGPELIEVTAEFVPGNSGSPIIHAKTGLIIGIATYLTVRDKKWLSEENAQAKIRRFGYRLDSVKIWQPVDWNAFARDRIEFEKVNQLTLDLARLLRDMGDGVIIPTLHNNPAIASHIRAFMDKVGTSTRVHPADRNMAATTLLRFMRTVSQQDIFTASRNIRYDYYIRSLNDEKAVRTQFADIFDKLVKELK